jgi:hypothetical protein
MPGRLFMLNVLLGAVALGAAAFIASEVVTPPKPVPLRARTSSEASPPPPPPDGKAPPAASGVYSVVATRNLFSPTRSEMSAGPQGTTRQAAMLPKPTLHGVVLRDGTPVAYLEDPTTKRVAGYRLGDSIGGGTVKAINADHVVLSRPEGAVDVRLRDPSKPRPAPTPPPAAAQPGRELSQPGTPGVPPLPQAGAQPGTPPAMQPGLQPGIVPGQPIPPSQGGTPPRRMLPPNVLRRVPPPASDATD